jgi:glutaredoxin-related protein
MQDKLPLYIKNYNLIIYLYKIVHNLEKEYKHTLGITLLDSAYEVLDNVIVANTLPNNKKFMKIKEVSSSFDKLKMRIRIAHDIGLISHKKFSFIIKQEIEIGLMINGWLKWAESPNTSICEHNAPRCC